MNVKIMMIILFYTDSPVWAYFYYYYIYSIFWVSNLKNVMRKQTQIYIYWVGVQV